MQNLNLGWCSITNESISRIAKKCPAMLDLNLSGFLNFTDVSVEKLDVRFKVRRRYGHQSYLK